MELYYFNIPIVGRNFNEYKAVSIRAIFLSYREINNLTDYNTIAGSYWALGMEHGGNFWYYDSVCSKRLNYAIYSNNWYEKFLSVSSIANKLQSKIRFVNIQLSGWEYGFFAVEILRQIVCEYGNDPSDVNT